MLPAHVGVATTRGLAGTSKTDTPVVPIRQIAAADAGERRKPIALHSGPAPIPTGPAERWSMDFRA